MPGTLLVTVPVTDGLELSAVNRRVCKFVLFEPLFSLPRTRAVSAESEEPTGKKGVLWIALGGSNALSP